QAGQGRGKRGFRARGPVTGSDPRSGGGAVMLDPVTLPGFGLGWLDASGPHADVVLSTRVRLARNLQGHAFVARAREGEREEILARVREAAARAESLKGGVTLELRSLPRLSRKILLERHLVSRELAGEDADGRPPGGAGVFLGQRESLGVMVNEEDHLRLQGLLSGLRLQEAYQLVDRLDEE